jgi:hypothetical protein
MATRKQRGGPRKHNRTRRSGRGGSSALSVESLHASFERIDGRMRRLIEHGKTDRDAACSLRKMWADQFHHRLSEPAVRGMLEHYRATARRVTRKASKKQQGGMAPLDYTMGQGIASQVYGRFPVEMSNPETLRAFDVDRFFESSAGRACDTTGGHAAPDTGKGQAGGGVFDALSVPHAPTSVPPNFLQTGLSAIQGVAQVAPGASPVADSVRTVTAAPRPFDTSSFQAASIEPLFKGF